MSYAVGSWKACAMTRVYFIPVRAETYSHAYRCFSACLWWAPHLNKEIASWALILRVIVQHPCGNLHYMENHIEKAFVPLFKRSLEEYGYWPSCKSWPWFLLLLFISSLLLPLALFPLNWSPGRKPACCRHSELTSVLRTRATESPSRSFSSVKLQCDMQSANRITDHI